jgi:hypothetical protein
VRDVKQGRTAFLGAYVFLFASLTIIHLMELKNFPCDLCGSTEFKVLQTKKGVMTNLDFPLVRCRCGMMFRKAGWKKQLGKRATWPVISSTSNRGHCRSLENERTAQTTFGALFLAWTFIRSAVSYQGHQGS